MRNILPVSGPGVILFLLFLFSFSFPATAVETGANTTITRDIWYLTSFTDTEGLTKEIIQGSVITLNIKADGTLSGFDGCNKYSGKWKTDGERFNVSTVIVTLMACMSPDGVMEQEQSYLDILGAVNRLSVHNQTLVLDSMNSSAELVFNHKSNVVSPATKITQLSGDPLAVSSWKLAMFSPKPEISEYPLKDTRITLTFEGKGKFSGYGGCNQYMGTYTSNGGLLSLNGAITTRMACMEPEGIMDQETTYLSLLKSVRKQKNNGSYLSLYDGKGREVLEFTRTVDIPETLTPVTPEKTIVPTMVTTELLNIKWKWVKQVTKDPFSIKNPLNFFIEFGKDNTYGIQADCNIGGGEYILSGNKLTIKPGFTTLAYCGDTSLDQVFLASLWNVTRYEFDSKGQLNLVMKDGPDRMIFRR